MSAMASVQKTGTKRTFSRRDSTNSQPPSVDSSLFRALVRTKGETHKRDHYVPSGERDTADTVSAYHLKKRDTTLPSARIAAVADFEFRPRGLNRDLLLTGTTTKGAWETRANSIQAQDGAAGAPLLITLFGQRISASEAGTIASLVCTSLERTYNCTGLEAFAFQLANDGKQLPHSAGRTIAVFGMSVENAKAAAARYAHCICVDDDSVIAFGAQLWDMPPNTHVATLEKVDHLGTPTEAMRKYIWDRVAQHIRERANNIGAFLVGNAKQYWGKGELSHDYMELLLDSLEIDIVVDVDAKKNRSVIINVYTLGVFADQWSVERWADQLIGTQVNLGEYGEATRAKRLHCNYCHDTDHYVRICRIPKHPDWFHKPEASKKPQAKPEDAGWTTRSPPSRPTSPASRNVHPDPMYNKERAVARTEPNVPLPQSPATMTHRNADTALDELEQQLREIREIENRLYKTQDDIPPEPPPPPDDPSQLSPPPETPDPTPAPTPHSPQGDSAPIPQTANKPRKKGKKKRARQQDNQRSLFTLPKAPRSVKNTKACVLLASQNMKGRGPANFKNNDKWRSLYNHMSHNKIGVCAIQETHMTEADAREAESAWQELRVFSSPSPDNPNGAGGVGVVLNKKIVCTKDAKSWVIIPGRAMVVSFNWHMGQKLAILAVYAPNTAKEQEEFWPKIMKTLKEKSHIPRPKFLLGDCNNVEAEIDRFPAHLNDTDLSLEFLELLSYLDDVETGRSGTQASARERITVQYQSSSST
ncbi:hypothetical protein EXIGLDRAFT_700310 [Exidia glandulosa HHB12029]|uniref:DNase I-like protein n=1 Tax=Exidia glandulosa HHB12029 TaxID=1314781 RepID=A0A165DHN5_EXIGL|nr:hypothetical protein EXIGLDRAFT_700310 [Exidia glandulosa HHB12029]